MATVIRHDSCPDCGSQDNLAVYDDGGEHCFTPGCGRHKNGSEGGLVGTSGAAAAGGGISPVPEAGDSGAPVAPLFSSLDITALNARRLTRTTCERYGYARVTLDGTRYQSAPYRDRTGRAVAWKLRDANKGFRWVGDKAAALPLFGQHLQTGGKMVVVTEGELDALSVSQALGNTWPVVSLPDGAGSWEKAFRAAVGWLDSFERVVLCFDMDDAGRAAAEAAAEFLPPGKVHLAQLPRKDASEMIQAGEGAALKRAVWGAPVWAPDGIIMGPDAWRKVMAGENRPAVASFPFPGLNTLTRGIRAGEIVLLTGASGCGKTTACRAMVWGFRQAGIRVGVVSLEETTRDFMLPLVGYKLGVNLRAVDGDPSKVGGYDEALEYVADGVVGFEDNGNRDLQWIFNRIRYMHVSAGCDVVILDNLTMILMSGAEDGTAKADRLVGMLEAFVKQTGVTLIVLTHLRKAPSNGPSFEEGRVPTQADIRGTGLIGAVSHTIIGMSRDQAENEGGRLHLLKCRLGGTGKLGPADELVYEESTGLLRSADDPGRVLEMAGADY